MTNLEDTGAINLHRRQSELIDTLLEQRAQAQPPRWMTHAARIAVALVAADTTAFAIHAAGTVDHSGVGVALGVHIAAFATLCLVTTHLLVSLTRIRLDIRRTTQQDQIDSYRHRRTIGAIRDALAAQPDIIGETVERILADRDRAKRREQWLGRAEQIRDELGVGDPGGGAGSVIQMPRSRASHSS